MNVLGGFCRVRKAILVVCLAALIPFVTACRGSFGGNHGEKELPSGKVTASHRYKGSWELCIVADKGAAARDFTTGKEYCLGGREDEGEQKGCKPGDFYPECMNVWNSQH